MTAMLSETVDSMAWWIEEFTSQGSPNTFESGRINVGGYNRARGIVQTGLATTTLTVTYVISSSSSPGTCTIVCALDIPLDAACSGTTLVPGNVYCYDIVLFAPYVELRIEETAGPGGDTITVHNEVFLV